MKLSILPKARKALAFLLTFALVLSTAAVMTLPTVADTVDVWDGTTADGYAGGTGTAEDPYQIATPEQLARLVGVDVLGHSDNIVNATRNKFYKLTADIYLNDVSDSRWYEQDGLKTWYTGTSSRFVGSLDGAGHTIRGLYFAADAGYAGLFPVIDAWEADRYFKNLTIADSYICASSMAGAIAARAYGNNNHGFTFDRCYVTDTVVVHATDVGGTAPWCGGFVGFSTTGKETPYSFADCAMLAKARDGGRMKYGLVGLNFKESGYSMSMSVRNSFACADDWQGLTLSGSADTSHLVSDPETIRGDAAKTAMPNLDWDTVWMPTADGYPVYKAAEVDVNGKVGAVWEGAVAKGYAGGTGSAEDPYLIKTANQLAFLVKHDIIDLGGGSSSNTMGKYYKLAADIYLNNVADPDWKTHTPNSWYSSDSGARFGGNLDGDGYTIYGLYYDGEGAAGLISYADIWSYDITIKNVTLSDSYIKTTHSFAGGLIAYVYGTNSAGKTLTVEGCFVDDNVTVWSTNAEGYAGGLVGCLRSNASNHYTFVDCGVLADVKGELWTNCAGLAMGSDGDYRIERCFAFPRLVIDSYGNAKDSTNSHILREPRALLEIRGEQARTTMADLDWENSAFTPVKDSYPRLKLVSQRLGDLNCDNVCDTADLAFLQQHLLGVAAAAVFDANCDGASDIRDLVDLKEKVDAFIGPDSAYVPAGYGLVWNDEFRGRTIDTAKWRTDPAGNRMTGTDELGCFDDGTVRSVGDGGLKMTALKNPDPAGYNGSQYITTTSISTENRMSFKYGYLEVKAKVPYKKGCWPSLWLRSPHAAQVEGETGLDDYNMEIDVIEPFGFTDKNRITIHETNKADSNDHRQLATGDYTFDDTADLVNEYHVYGFLWTESAMKFYVDGAEFASFSMEALREMGYASSFDDTVNILFNNHLFTASGEFNGGDENNIIENHEDSLPSIYAVDYIRLYQQENSGSVLLLR